MATASPASGAGAAYCGVSAAYSGVGAASTAAAVATAAAAAAAMAAAAASTATTAPAATAVGKLYAGPGCLGIFFVEDIERRQADVRDFLFTEKGFVTHSGVLRWRIRGSRTSRSESAIAAPTAEPRNYSWRGGNL